MGGFVSIYFSFCFLLCFVYLFYFKCLSLLKKILLQYYYFFISSFIASFIFNLTQLLQNLMVHNLMLTYNPKLVIPQMLLAYMKSSDLNLLKSANLGGFIFVYFSFCFLLCFVYLSVFKCLSLLKEILLQYYCLISSSIASFIFTLTRLLQNLMVHNLMLTYNPKLVIPQMLLAHAKSSVPTSNFEVVLELNFRVG